MTRQRNYTLEIRFWNIGLIVVSLVAWTGIVWMVCRWIGHTHP